jgi:hypothetical protein
MQMGALLDKSRSVEDRRIGICVLDDLLEHSSEGLTKYFSNVRVVVT